MTGLVHVVDDNEGVCSSLRALLELRGYDVRSHATAQSFLDNFNPEEAICIISDMMMPNMSGLELQEHLVQKKVSVPLIIITGHGDVPTAVRAQNQVRWILLRNPWKAALFWLP